MASKQKSSSAANGRPRVTRGRGGRFAKMSASGDAVHETPHTDLMLRHAHQSHEKQQTRPITLQSNANVTPAAAKAGHKQRFSFPVALSQVRDRVYVKSKTVKSVRKASPAKAKPVNAYSRSLSPFVLDLKHRRTVVHHGLPSLHTAKRATTAAEDNEKQGVLSLFEDRGSAGLPRAAHPLHTWFPGLRGLFRGKSHINFVPRPEAWTLPSLAKRAQSKLAWNFMMIGRAMIAPAQFFRRLRMQKKLQLQWGNELAEPTPFVAEETRAGRPIAARHVSPLIRMRQSLAAVVDAPARLSELDPEALGKPLIDALTPRSLARAVAPFAGMCAVVVLVVMAVSGFQQVRDYRRQVLGATDVALRELQKAADTAGSMEFLPASTQFETAAQSFKAAAAVMENQASPIAKLARYLPGVNSQVKAAQSLLQLGSDLSAAAHAVSEGAAVFADNDHFLATQPLSYKLEYFFVRLGEARPLIDRCQQTLQNIDTASIPEDARAQVEALRESLPLVSAQLQRLSLLQEPLLAFLGHEHLERHLVLFQNDTELRATGGFMGSFALVDMDRGQITDINIPGGGPYDLQGSLLTFVQAPRALRLINPRWEFQDTNWFLDWPTSAAKVSSFYEKAGGPSVDGVVAIDTHVLEALLKTLGPVKLPTYGVEITADNFRQLLQEQVEVKYDRTENKPKKIIADLAPALLERIKSLPANQALELAAVLSEQLTERHIQIAHHNPDIQAVFSQLGWGGEVVQTPGDYLAVVNTNVAGGKTDGVINDSYDLNIHIDEQGLATHTLNIKREHTGKKGVGFSGVRNVDYLRVYVPAGSTLVSATSSEVPPANLFEQPDAQWSVDATLAASDGTYRLEPGSNTEIYQESGKTVFAQWLQVDPGQDAVVTLVYTVPQSVQSYVLPQREASWTDWFSNQPVRSEQTVRAYSFYWQKQPGAWDPKLSVSVDHPQSWRVQSLDGTTAVVGPGTVSLNAEQKTDQHLQLIFY